MTNRIDELSERARWYLAEFDEIDLADICASQEAAKQRAEAALARVRAAIDSIKAAGRGHTPTTPHDKGVAEAIDWVTMRVLTAIDARLTNQPAPAATQATDHQEQPGA